MFSLIVVAALAVSAQALQGQVGQPIGFASCRDGTRGGAGGTVVTVSNAYEFREAVRGNKACIIYVAGRIDLSVLGTVVEVGSYKTIIGQTAESIIVGGRLRIRQQQQVIIQNIKFEANNAYTEISDIILVIDTVYLWIDQCEFSGFRSIAYINIKGESDYMTISRCIFGSYISILIGYSETSAAQGEGRLKTTLVYNWFAGATQCPILRYGEVHVLNNLFTNLVEYGFGVGTKSAFYVEQNVFQGTRVCWQRPAGEPGPAGSLVNDLNLFEKSSFEAVSSVTNFRPNTFYRYQAILSADVEVRIKASAGAQYLQ